MNLLTDKHAHQHVCILMPRAKPLRPIAISCVLTLLYWLSYKLSTDWHNCTFAYFHIHVLSCSRRYFVEIQSDNLISRKLNSCDGLTDRWTLVYNVQWSFPKIPRDLQLIMMVKDSKMHLCFFFFLLLPFNSAFGSFFSLQRKKHTCLKIWSNIEVIIYLIFFYQWCFGQLHREKHPEEHPKMRQKRQRRML